jgi:hypothetical protein
MPADPSTKENFISAAADHGRFTESGDFKKCNKAYDRIIEAIHKFKESPDCGEGVLVHLLDYPDDSVKSWAAVCLLRLRPDEAMKILEDVAGRSGLVAFSAEMTLKEWQAGRLKLPGEGSGEKVRRNDLTASAPNKN